MKRAAALFAILFVCASLTVACGGAEIPRGTNVTAVPGVAMPGLFERIVFAVDDSLAGNVLTAAQDFCRRAGASGLMLAASEVPDAISALKSGEAGFALLDGKKAASLDSLFAVANENFRYKSYEHFAVSCNSASVRRALSEQTGVSVFAAYYTGSGCFVSFGALGDALAATEASSESGEPYIVTAQGSGTGEALELSGFNVEDSPLSSRLLALDKPNGVIEAAYDEVLKLPELFDDGSGLPGAEFGQFEIVLTRSFHDIAPIWFVVSPEVYASLPPQEQAAIDEAAAFMAADIDSFFLSREQEALVRLEDLGIRVSDDFSLLRSRVLRSRNRSLSGLTPHERTFRGLLDNIY